MIEDDRIEAVRLLIRRGEGRVHMMGIGGVGMAGLAYLLKRRGLTVDGCDKVCGPLCHWVVSAGMGVVQDHCVSHAEGEYDLVVHTAAVNEADKELVRFREKKVLSARRGEVLPLMFDGLASVAVAGTHGKTTASTFTAHILKHCGLAAGWCIGGVGLSLGGVAWMPDNCDVLVVEADESDGTLRRYQCDIAVITNVEYDHMEHFSSAEDFEGCFADFAANARRRVIYCADDPVALKIGRSVKGSISYGVSAGADLRISGMELMAQGSKFEVSGCGLNAEKITLTVPGRHNVLNASAAILAALEFGVDMEAVRAALDTVVLPDRRYQEIVGGEVSVVSDYAHHPTEIRALIDTAGIGGAVGFRAVFQPHRYTRTKALLADFPSAFKGVDELVLVPVYAASEMPLSGGGVQDLYLAVRRAGVVKKLLYARSLAAAWAYYSKSLESGDRLLVIGAGDVEQIAYWLKRDYVEKRCEKVSGLYAELAGICGERVEFDYPLGRRTTIGCGGNADAFVRINSAKLLSRVWTFCNRKGLHMHVVGAGSNMLVSDLGVRGVTVRLEGDGLNEIVIDGECVFAGAGVPISRLMEALEEAGLSGLEFLEGIPGMVGGAVKMNAGAHGREMGAVLERINCLDADAGEMELTRDDIVYGYRSMPCLNFRIVTSVELRCRRADRGRIAALREEYREKRSWMNGLRSLGSVFRNPAGGYAGRIIEECGLKGMRAGGISISEQHANVFVNDGTGSASDMLCLMDVVSAVVRDKTGIVLEREMVILD